MPQTSTVASLPAVAETGQADRRAVSRKQPGVACVHAGADRGAEAARLTGGNRAAERPVVPRRRGTRGEIRRLVDANIIGIFISSRKGEIIEANDAFLKMVGYDREDLAAGNVRLTDLTPPEWRASTARALQGLDMTGVV